MPVRHAEPLDEVDHPPVKAIALTIGVAFGVVFACLPVALFILWKMTIFDEKTIDVGMADPRRLEYIQTKEAVLSGARASRQNDAKVHIPITQAMELIVKQQGSLK